MLILKCNICGNAYGKPPMNFGDMCQAKGCRGTLILHPTMNFATRPGLMLKCNKCGNVFAESANRKLFGLCNVNNCTGRLGRYGM